MIVLDKVRFSYDPRQAPDVVAGVTLTITDGQHVALLGRNGSGKSSLARLLNGLQCPTGGSLHVDGLNVADPTLLPEIRRSVQMVFQNPENQQVGTTVFDDIAFGLANFAVPTAEMSARALAALAQVGLDVGLSRDINTLSGGELQRLALASVVALRPKHLVLDEVTSMLDPAGRAQVLAAIRRLRSESGMSVIQITHHLEEIEDADRVIVLDAGRVCADASVAEVLADSDLLMRCGLEAPYRWRRPSVGGARHPRPVGVDRTTIEAAGVTHDYSAARRGRRLRTGQPAGPTAPVLSGIRLAIAPGELLAVAGRSGAGKTTLISIIKGLLRPTAGAVLVEGTDAWRARRPELFDRIGYVFQHPEHQLFAPSVRADVGFGLRSSQLPADEAARRVDAQLRRVGLDPDEIGDRSPFELSGGQQRRAAFAGILVTEPRVLILDEPSAGLDGDARAGLFSILREAREQGLAVVWVSHRLEEILEHAERQVVLDDGGIVADGPPRGLLSDAGLRARLDWPLLPELDPTIAEGIDRQRHLTRSGAPEVA